MAHVERVSVEGFKTIAELSVEPGQFTVVTGRNNSGKTSLLEAVRLGCEPETVRGFRAEPTAIDENPLSETGISSQIRRGSSEAVVETATDAESGRLKLQQVSDSHAREVVAGVVVDLLEQLFDGDSSLKEEFQSRQASKSNERSRVTLRGLVTEFLTGVDTELSSCVVKYTTEKKQYPIVSRPEVVRDLLSSFGISDVAKKLGEDNLEKLGVTHTDSGMGAFTTPRNLVFAPDTFPDGKPDTRVPTKFVTHGTTVDADDDDPVKTDDIGDFLREKGILEDLKTFTLDDLIFDPDDGEKYAVPFDQMGDGFQAIVALLWELLDDDLPEVVFLEEPTTHMHPGYVREVVYFLIQLAMEDDVQLFVTTHSNDFLNDLFAENLREEEVAFLEEEFKLFQMQDGGAKTLDYREAEESLEELMLDLRGL